jgi:acetolactate synthase-1/2/3 large subunit
MVSSGEAVLRHLGGAPSFDLLLVTGGSFAQGLPAGCSSKRLLVLATVIAFRSRWQQHVHSQSRWTMPRERLDVVVVILDNPDTASRM